MTRLPETQRAFFDWLLRGDTRIRRQISTSGRADIDTRLAIYANAYRLRLQEALQDTFPALHTLLGDERFRQLGMDYLQASPSEHFSIRYFGHHLARFLAQSPTLADNPLLGEMAAFEWALRDAFDAADGSVATAETLRAIPATHWPDMRIDLHASVRRLDLGWNVPQLWQAIDQASEPVAPESLPAPISWLIWRKDLKTYYRSMAVDEASLIDACLQHATFAELCAALCEWVDEQHAAQRVTGFLSQWCEEGIILKNNWGQSKNS